MKVSYNWLKRYIDLSYTPEELDYVLTMAGLEVDSMEYLGEGIEDIIIGEIEKIEEHPNADKLVICQLNTGDELLQIVTGAPNVVEGARVPVARTGVELPNGMKIKKTKLRGEPSNGMLCSTDELGLSQERASGIMILGEEAVPGEKLVKYLGLDDYVFDLDLTPNYARCLGMLGIARELKSLQEDVKVKRPEIKINNDNKEDIRDYVSIEVMDKELCPRYTGQIIKNVKIGPSPEWMQQNLKAAGIRPINNVVDITNYVLLEYNQPLHAFDFDTINEKKIIVRRARSGEKLITLDDQERQLNEEMLVIADTKEAVGLAGVMGGANSEVTEDTSTIFLESAYFNPVNIRKTAKKLGLPSEASHRFERGIDIEGVVEAGRRAAYLMQEYAAGEVVSGIIDIYPEPYQPLEIVLETDYVNNILGISLTAKDISQMLNKLGFLIKGEKEGLVKVAVPSYRNDVEREADLIEELARVYGYNNIPVTVPESKQQGGKTSQQSLEDISRELMISAGLDEIINFSLQGKEDYELFRLPEDSRLREWVRIKNPLNESYALMRTSLLPGIVELLSNNAKRQIDRMAVFEIGNVFFRQVGEEPFQQELKLAGGSMGYPEDSWQSAAADFFYLKGVLESYFSRLGIDSFLFKPARQSFLHPGRTASIELDGGEIGYLGELLPAIITELDLKERTALFQLDLTAVIKAVNLDKKYSKLPKYPAVERDLAILVKNEINSGEILRLLKREAGDILKKVEIFDLYEGDQIPEGLKSLAFKLLFQAEDRTLRDEEVNELFNKILKLLRNFFSAEIRGN
ncbi:phenylalanine--tRNA ligase subunit beta [Iocasia frigidifontis]|uniref:Phenylalanine--tRNA ligase beta subunit n=1 Tax=Iocasia fonsfrigidae TaxID=2682810 RepID=A0A8A7KBG5_9FIRM|nr:phenylalanine--tRNA ligase subunit beta [Iocasia fonsfrigidae]QTL98580.1 phenylalanine--tRNA ligase subunit beta [Iocasia fonsfrigidae]